MLARTRTHVHTLPCADPHGQTHVRARQLWRAMNYNTLCLKLSSCLHGSTLTSLSSALFTSLSASLLYASPQPCLCFPPFPPSLASFGFLLSSIFPLPSWPRSLYSSSTPFVLNSIYFDIYLPFIPPLLFLRGHPSSYLLRVCACSAAPPSPSPSLHLISDTLTWLSPLLPREAGEPLFPLIPANAICKH